MADAKPEEKVEDPAPLPREFDHEAFPDNPGDRKVWEKLKDDEGPLFLVAVQVRACMPGAEVRAKAFGPGAQIRRLVNLGFIQPIPEKDDKAKDAGPTPPAHAPASSTTTVRAEGEAPKVTGGTTAVPSSTFFTPPKADDKAGKGPGK